MGATGEPEGGDPPCWAHLFPDADDDEAAGEPCAPPAPAAGTPRGAGPIDPACG